MVEDRGQDNDLLVEISSREKNTKQIKSGDNRQFVVTQQSDCLGVHRTFLEPKPDPSCRAQIGTYVTHGTARVADHAGS